MRLFLIILAVALLVVLPFLFWGGAFEDAFRTEAAVEWFRGLGPWAWAAAIGLLSADLVLPVPATSVMAALGIIYGPLVGGCVGAVGSFLAGIVAYLLCRLLGRKAAAFLAGEKDLARCERFFAKGGGWAVALSRWMPILPETVACLAGLARMPMRRFVIALAVGCLPMGFSFAVVGHIGAANPLWAVLVAALIPLLLWPAASFLTRAREGNVE